MASPSSTRTTSTRRAWLTTMGSQFYSSRVATKDAEVVRKLKAAGAVLLGKANMNEFAAGVAGLNQFYGNTANPWDLGRWSGGSSSGSGVSVAAGLALGGLGTDTGVSVRGPASWMGLVGVRPSYGRVSVRGTFPRAYSLDTVGPLTHTVEDAALLLNAIAGYDPRDPFAVRAPDDDFTRDLDRGVEGLRIGIVEDFTFRNVDPEVAQAVREGVRTLRDRGARIKNVRSRSSADRSTSATRSRSCCTSSTRSSATPTAPRRTRACSARWSRPISRRARRSRRRPTTRPSRGGPARSTRSARCSAASTPSSRRRILRRAAAQRQRGGRPRRAPVHRADQLHGLPGHLRAVRLQHERAAHRAADRGERLQGAPALQDRRGVREGDSLPIARSRRSIGTRRSEVLPGSHADR